MPLYLGSEKVKDRTSPGLYVSSSKILKAYLGSDLVYQFETYNPDTVLSTVTNGNTYSTTLGPGVYQLHITGGGGNYGAWAYGGYPWAAGGGSGATWEGIFYISTSMEFVMFGAGARAASYMNLGGVRMITANAGGGGGMGGGGGGGSISVAADFSSYVVSTSVSRNGNAGAGTTFGGSQTGGASTSSNKWGGGTVLQGGAVQYGGAKLWYIRYNR